MLACTNAYEQAISRFYILGGHPFAGVLDAAFQYFGK
jgi:hypothetical protein